MPTSLRIPFNVTGGKVATTTNTKQIVEQKIINVLTTGKLERIMRPLYGAGVQSMLFGNIDDLIAVDFKTDAATEMAENITGMTLIDIAVETTTVETEAKITVYYRTPLSDIQSTSFLVVVPGLLDEESPIF